MNDIEQFKEQTSSLIYGFPLPDWVETVCPVCSSWVCKEDIMGMEIFFVAMFLGDISFSYHCKKCQCAFNMHLKCNVETIHDVVRVLGGDGDYPFVNREKLISEAHHNLRSPDWNEIPSTAKEASLQK